MKKQTFVQGAMILVIANAISKILGAVFKIPLTYILQEEGMAIFNTAFQVYIMVLSFIISGMPLAISKMVAESTATRRYSDVGKIVRVTMVLLGAIGLAGSIVMFAGARYFAAAMKDMKAVYSIQAIAPALFFVALGVVYKSYYQGTQNMIPTALSQVIEAIIKLAAGYGFAVYLAAFAVEITSAGAIMGVTIGEIIATLVLMMLYRREKRKQEQAEIPTGKILKNVFAIAVPMIFASLISNMFSVIDITMIRARLQDIVFTPETAELFFARYGSFTHVFDEVRQTLRITEDGARWLYGAYSGYALTIFHLPGGIIGALGVSILPVIAGALAVGNHQRVERSTQLALRITVLVALPCAVGMLFLAKPMLSVLFHNTASTALLAMIAPCVLMTCVVSISTAILQAAGKIMLPFWYMVVGSLVKLVLNFFLLARPECNILGAPISSDISYILVMALNLGALKKVIGLKYDIVSILIKPAAAAVMMGSVIYLLSAPIEQLLASSGLALGVCASAGGLAYVLMLVLTKAVTLREIKSMVKRM
jgi:stage V sporulation protein B